MYTTKREILLLVVANAGVDGISRRQLRQCYLTESMNTRGERWAKENSYVTNYKTESGRVWYRITPEGQQYLKRKFGYTAPQKVWTR